MFEERQVLDHKNGLIILTLVIIGLALVLIFCVFRTNPRQTPCRSLILFNLASAMIFLSLFISPTTIELQPETFETYCTIWWEYDSLQKIVLPMILVTLSCELMMFTHNPEFADKNIGFKIVLIVSPWAQGFTYFRACLFLRYISTYANTTHHFDANGTLDMNSTIPAYICRGGLSEELTQHSIYYIHWIFTFIIPLVSLLCAWNILIVLFHKKRAKLYAKGRLGEITCELVAVSFTNGFLFYGLMMSIGRAQQMSLMFIERAYLVAYLTGMVVHVLFHRHFGINLVSLLGKRIEPLVAPKEPAPEEENELNEAAA